MERPSTDDVRDRIGAIAPEQLSITPGLWLAADDMTRVAVAGLNRPERTFFIRQQTKSGQAAPPPLAGYRLEEDHYHSGLHVFGIPISRTPGGWEFALYERSP